MIQKLSPIILRIILIAHPTSNCTCVYNIKSDYQNYDTVFRAKVIGVSKINTSDYNQKVTLEILKTYKGDIKPRKYSQSILGFRL